MLPYTYLLFDLDGTISESAPGIIRSVRYGLAAVGIDEDDMDKLHTFIGPPLNTQMKKLYDMKDEDIVTAVLKFRELYESSAIYDCSAYEGIEALLKDARAAGYKLAVASSKPEPSVKEIIRHFGFADLFHVICGSDPKNEFKKGSNFNQKAWTIQTALSRLEAQGAPKEDLASHAVMIGDTGYDADGAAMMHLPCIGVTYGYGSREELEAHHTPIIVDSVAELRSILAL